MKQPTADVGNDNTEGAPDIITVGIELGTLGLTAAGEAATGEVVEVALLNQDQSVELQLLF